MTTASDNMITVPPQTEGLPYTRSAHRAAMQKIGNHISVFAGSRYAYVYGARVRLDDTIPLKLEAVSREGELFVPLAFAGALALPPAEVKADKVPDDLACLAERWVHTIERTKSELPAGVKAVEIHGQSYVSVVALATAKGRRIYSHPRGLVLVGDGDITFSEDETTLLDTVISQFDTPEKFADPDIATRHIPSLKKQGAWHSHALATPEARQALAAPEAEWPMIPQEQYDLSGFNHPLLGSKVPAPGVYPRILFSPGDIPMFQERIKKNKFAQKAMIETELLFKKSWWNPESSDGQVFQNLAEGRTDKLEFPADPDGIVRPGFAKVYKGQVQGIHSTHIIYNAQCLTTMALYCLLTDDNERGRQVANAIYTYCTLGEPAIDAHLATSDSEWGADPSTIGNTATTWNGMHVVVPRMELPFLLDFGGKWMTSEQKDGMRRIIAKATYGRRSYGGDGPRRNGRDVNWLTWHLDHGLAISAIEGLDGFDPEAYQSYAELAHDFLEWGIDRNGQIFESNGKNGGGLQFQLLSMIAMARRGDNLWGHPHLRKLLAAQVYTTSPDGKITLSSGTLGNSPLSLQAVNEIKAFYPENPCADYLLSNGFPELDLARFNVEAYRRTIEESDYCDIPVIVSWRLTETQKQRAGHRLAGYVTPAHCRQRHAQYWAAGTTRLDKDQMRLPGPSYPGFTSSILYDTDWRKTSREDLKLPLNWEDPVHGVVSAASDQTSAAAWLCFHVRPNHYMGTGHHHADAGMFHFAAGGVNWFTESALGNDAQYHNLVGIDGQWPVYPPSRAAWLGSAIRSGGAMAAADLTYFYSWRWCTQVKDWKDGHPLSHICSQPGRKIQWELETNQDILAYNQGAERYKMRPWWLTYNFSNFMPTLRAPMIPVESVYRSTGLIRGKHPYAVVVDDLKKDADKHCYQWRSVLGPGIWQAESGHLPPNQVLLAWDGSGNRNHAGAEYLFCENGEPMLLACALGLAETNPTGSRSITVKSVEAPGDASRPQAFYDVLSAEVNRVQARFRMLFIPLKAGDPIPEISYDDKTGTAVVAWVDQEDLVTFNIGADNRTHFTVTRNSQPVLSINEIGVGQTN